MKPDWKEKIANAPESFKARNPHLYQPVARRIRAPQSESNVRSEVENSRVETSEEGVRYCVVFTTYRKRLLDEGDNSNSALKGVRDRIAYWLSAPNDSSRYFDFEYHQIKSDTIHGTHVLVKRL